jgi:RNA polymerase sigma factor (sigma-70 family)
MKYLADSSELITSNEVWHRFRNGEKEAFEEIYQKYFRTLCIYGHRLTCDTQILEDAIHDVFIDLWRRREFLSEVTEMKFYLFKALRNQLYRSGKRNVFDKSENIDDFLDYLITISSEQESIESENHADQVQNINYAISKLSPRQQEVINLRFFHGLGLDETAQLMGLSKQSVSNLLFKSYAVLRLTVKILSYIPFLIIVF